MRKKEKKIEAAFAKAVSQVAGLPKRRVRHFSHPLREVGK